MVKNLSAMQETQEMVVRYPGREDSLEEEMATYSSILAWKIPGGSGTWPPPLLAGLPLLCAALWTPLSSESFLYRTQRVWKTSS